jgi:hypothetical protein
MPILGSSASPKGVPSTPTIGTATAGDGSASVTFTAPSFSKLPITSYTVTASPGGATGTGASSPITVSGLSSGTAYTFTVRASHANGQSAASSASNSATPLAPYVLAQTFNASGNYTVPSGKTQIGVLMVGGGANGSIGSGSSGGAGGAGSKALAVYNIPTNAATNYVITVGGIAGTSQFGNIASVSLSSTSFNSGTSVVANGGSGSGGSGGQGGVGETITSPVSGFGNIQAGGGGGGGGARGNVQCQTDAEGGWIDASAGGSSGGSGGASGGGNGGAGGGASFSGGSASYDSGGDGSAGAANFGGGGGGGGSGGRVSCAGSAPFGNGGSGGTGRVLVYIR